MDRLSGKTRSCLFAGLVTPALGVALIVLPHPGCVRRSLTIETVPPGARVFLNDQEVGRSPVQTDFLWYGDYDVVIRKQGYRSLQTHHELTPPWYQVPPIDFLAEVLCPARIHDERFASFTLEPEQLPGRTELIERAEALRDEALEQR